MLSNKPLASWFTVEEYFVQEPHWRVVASTRDHGLATSTAYKIIDWKNRPALQSVRIVAHYPGQWASEVIYEYQPQGGQDV